MTTDLAAPQNQKHPKIFFSNLNGVRAIACLMVVVAHIELHKKEFGISRIPGIDLFNLGKVGVTVFFSLSGFLITYLLLQEKLNYVKIDFKDFYIRRVLRIWPLYFLVIIVGFFIYPKVSSLPALWLSVFFLPNIAFTLSLLPAIFDPVWSIGIEEQFYIFHPHFFRIKKVQHILYALVLFVVFFFVADILLRHLYHGNNVAINQLFYYARYDDMMIGAIVAVLYFNTKNNLFNFKFQKLFDLVFKRYVQVVLLVLFFLLVGFYINYTIPQGDVILAILSALIIINLCESDTSILSLKNNGFQFTGRISYGIYLLHKFPLFLVLYLVKKYLTGQPLIIQNITLYAATFIASICLASVSYYGYERYFLQFKKRFQKIKNNEV